MSQCPFAVVRRLVADRGGKTALGDGRARALRYLLVGGLAWLLDVAVFALCVGGIGVAPAQLCARVGGAVFAFFGHRVFVFRATDGRPATIASQAVRYATLWLLSFAVSTLALIGLIDHAGVHALTAKLGVEIGVVAMNYLVLGSLIFPPARPTKA